MSERRRNPAAVAKGYRHNGEMLKVVILLDDETFEQVSAGAQANQCSFAAQARMLIEVGLETLSADDAATRLIA